MNKKVLGVLCVVVLALASVFLAVESAAANAGSTNFALCSGNEAGTTVNGLRVKKDVYCSAQVSKSWSWTISKAVDQSSLTLALGESQAVNYTVIASAVAQTAATYDMAGNILLQNTTSAPIIISSVTDSLGPVNCPFSFPYTLPAGFVTACTYDGISTSYAPAENTVIVESSVGQVVESTPITWPAPVVTEIDECATISDSFAGGLGTVCAGDQTSFTFNYSRTIGPFDICGEYTVDNTAAFTTNDSGSTGSDEAAVGITVPCTGGACTLTPGYWKTHSSFGPAPYDATWALLGEGTTFFYSGTTYYGALWTNPSGGNAYWILAHAYIAARLNQLNAADFSAAQTAFDSATALFSNPANTPAAIGALRGGARAAWTNLATILDNYNNGLIGPGHCE